MKVTELTQDQLDELKMNYSENLKKEWHEVTNEEIFKHYNGIYFVNDDFFCSMEDNSEIF